MMPFFYNTYRRGSRIFLSVGRFVGLKISMIERALINKNLIILLLQFRSNLLEKRRRFEGRGSDISSGIYYDMIR